MLWWARWFTTNLECALFWGQKPLPLMGATRPASEKIQLLFSRVRIIPPFSIPTRDASPPLVLAFFATKPVSFLMPILNTLPPPGLPPHSIKHYTVVIILSSAYLAPIQYYAHLYAADHALVDLGEHYVKQTYRNRCYIATPSGAQPLTLPVVRDGVGHTPMGEVRLSDHGDWRHLHWNALASAYEGSPYFEYYADDFRPLYEHPFEYLADFNAALHNVVLSLLSLTPSVEVSRDYVAEVPAGAADLRNSVSPKVPIEHDVQFRVQPYYQVFKERTGFLPNLSIVDLLFNMGPESRMVLKQSLI